MAERRWTIILGEITAAIGVAAVIATATAYIVDSSTKAANAVETSREVKEEVHQLAKDVAYTRGRVDAIAEKLNVPAEK